MNKYSRVLAAGALLCAAAFIAGTTNAAVPESKDTIKVAVNDWTASAIMNGTFVKVLEQMGYNAELVQADYLAQFTGLESGDLHFNVEISATVALDVVAASLATGKTIDLGLSGPFVVEDWWYPAYMVEHCPGLPDWKVLREPSCAEAFATPETAPKGRFLAGPVAWGGWDDEKIASLGLPWEVVHAGSDGALFAELASAHDRKAAIMLWLWQPHWAPIKYKGSFVEFPTYTQECHDDPAWGENPDMAYDCGRPSGLETKMGWAGGESKWPAAYAAARKFNMDNDVITPLISAVEIDGRDINEVIAEWMSNNEAVWKGWTQ